MLMDMYNSLSWGSQMFLKTIWIGGAVSIILGLILDAIKERKSK